MRFRIEKKPKLDRTKPHTWFAWHPVRIGPYLYWLCFVERVGTEHDDSMGDYWSYKYTEATWYP